MGPFPHDAPKAVVDAINVAGTDGFEFVEFAHPDPAVLEKLFTAVDCQLTNDDDGPNNKAMFSYVMSIDLL